MATAAQRRSFRRTWLPKLLKMRTTKKEARLLVKRFTAVLEAMDDGEDAVHLDYGCPHCAYDYRGGGFVCDKCDYPKVFPRLKDEERGIFITCARVPFCGVCLDDIRDLRLWWSDCGLEEGWEAEEQEIRDFCEGHLIWARAVLDGKT